MLQGTVAILVEKVMKLKALQIARGIFDQLRYYHLFKGGSMELLDKIRCTYWPRTMDF
jgi:hypothetical protein